MTRPVITACLALAPLVAFGAIKAEPLPDLRPPRPEIPALFVKDNRIPWLVGAVFFAVVAAVICWPRRRHVPAPPSPFLVAQREFGALRSDSSLATPASVSSILRRYAVAAFDLPGSGVTAEEVASGLAARRSCPVDLANATWQFLAECDVEKFAPGVQHPPPLPILPRAEKLLADLEAARTASTRSL